MDNNAPSTTKKPIFLRFFDFFIHPPAVRAYADLVERDRQRREEKEAMKRATGEI